MSPYAILGLAEDESDERTIKRAYAKLLKQHRPDQDPEGFKRIHDAYQALSARFGTTATFQPAAHFQARPKAVAADPPAADVAWDVAIAALRAAVALPLADNREEALTGAVAAMVDVLACDGGDWAQARRLMVPLVHDQPRRWGAVSDSMVVQILAQDPAIVEELLLNKLKRNAHQDGVRLLSTWVEAIEQRGDASVEETKVFERMLTWCVFLDFKSAARMGALIYPGLGAQRAALCDLALAAGHVAMTSPLDIQSPLAAIVSGTDRSRSPSVQAIGFHIRGLGSSSPLHQFMSVHQPLLLSDTGIDAALAGSEDKTWTQIARMILIASAMLTIHAFSSGKSPAMTLIATISAMVFVCAGLFLFLRLLK